MIRDVIAIAIGGTLALSAGLPLAWEIDRRMQPEFEVPEFAWPEDVYPPEYEEPTAMPEEDA